MSLSLQARAAPVAGELLRALNGPGEAVAPAALAIARVEYPGLDIEPYLQRLERMGEAAAGAAARAQARTVSTRDRDAERLPLRGARLHRQPRALRRSAQQLPERGPRSAHRHPDQPGGRLPRGRTARRPAARRREFSRPLPGARPGGAGRRRSDRRSVPQRRAALRSRLPAAAAPASSATKRRSIRRCSPPRRASRSSCACW